MWIIFEMDVKNLGIVVIVNLVMLKQSTEPNFKPIS